MFDEDIRDGRFRGIPYGRTADGLIDLDICDLSSIKRKRE